MRIVEIFKDIYIDDSPTPYMISDAGRVMNKRTKKILKPTLDKRGYEKYRLHISADKKCSVSAHRLVAIAFIPNYDDKRTVNHIDGNKRNNDVTNLEWATDHEQMQHSIQHGLRTFDHFKGSKNPNFKYSDEIVHLICKLLEDDVGTREIARRTGVTATFVYLIRKGILRKDISCTYKINRDCKLTYYSDELKDEIASLLDQKFSYTEIIRKLNLPDKQSSYSLISNVRSKITKSKVQRLS